MPRLNKRQKALLDRLMAEEKARHPERYAETPWGNGYLLCLAAVTWRLKAIRMQAYLDKLEKITFPKETK